MNKIINEHNPANKLESLANDILDDLWNSGLNYYEIDKIIRIIDSLMEDKEREKINDRSL